MNKEDKTIKDAIDILDNKLRGEPCEYFNNSESVTLYLRLKLEQLEYEAFAIMLLDNKHRLIKYIEMFRGTINEARVYPREVFKEALINNAAAIILAHNHPSGCSEPSQSDKDITGNIATLSNLLDIRLLDHIIIGKGNSYSFAGSGLL